MTQLTVKAGEPLKIIVRPIEKVNFTPVSFKNTENGLTLAGILFTPRDFNPEDNYPAVVSPVLCTAQRNFPRVSMPRCLQHTDM